MLLYHRILPRLLSLPSSPTSKLLIRPSRLPPRRPFLPRCAALSALAAPQTVDHSDAEESADHLDAEEPQEPQEPQEVQVKLPLDRLFLPPGASVTPGDEEVVTARVLKGSNIVLGTYARGDAQVVNADFIKSSVRPDDCPRDGLPEFALVGRSNVGKSSLLNSLVRRKRLALTSKKPGKTQCINHFKINDSWYLVDLPGYGYASAPQVARKDWDEFTRNYFLSRDNLVSVFLLIDASIPAKKIDLDYASWLGQNKVPMTLVFTKCDKRKKKKNGGKRPEENVECFQSLIREYFEAAPPWIMTSSVTNQGRDEILLHMSQLRNYWRKH
ncbi:GTP-binding protein At2g22870-like [Triticum urartu]|uniref:EngB-type G domain-containing protein n=1 Tax=Triticum urartu TaxID=4572 RepID=A0A8R7PUW6_TRIUA|nr:GTP-binding protein At2g22870-like [Triticum urartu]